MKKLLLTAVVLGTVFAAALPICAGTLYETVKEENVLKGVTYENRQRLTESGYMNIHALAVDLGAGTVSVSPVTSASETGKIETVLQRIFRRIRP